MSRPVTLGAQGCILDASGNVLLVRHTYRPGWHFPGGGVERDESTLEALKRELEEEAGVRITAPPRLHGVFYHGPPFPGDHIVVYVVRSWTMIGVPSPNHEIAEQRFFAANALPADVHPPTARRMAEIVAARQPDEVW